MFAQAFGNIDNDLCKCVNEQLFPCMRRFKNKAAGSHTMEYKIGEIFSKFTNRITSGYNLRGITICFPVSPDKQLKLAKELDCMSAEMRRLAGLYEKNAVLSQSQNSPCSIRHLL